MAASVWVLGTLLLGVSFRLVGGGGIVVLLGTLVGARALATLLGPPDG